MKKLMFFALASAFMFACSDDDSVPNNAQEGANGTLTFEISAVNDLNTGVTRGPVYSQAPDQHVARVSVYVFQENNSQYLNTKTYEITGWTDGMTIKRFEVPTADNLPQGNYKFLAVGRDASDQYGVTVPNTGTTFESMIASITASGNESEIFAGWTAATIASEGSRVSIQMTRKVAGVLGYFKNVPQTLNGKTVKYLRLSVSATNTAVNLSTSVGSTAGTAPFNLIDIDLSTQAVSGEVYAGNDLTGQGVVKLDKSQLGGAFLLPVTNVKLTLGLYDSTNAAIKTWVVKDSNNGGSDTFNITANHFYSLGTKTQAGNTNGGTGGDTGDDDAAIDLLTDQNIVVTISPAWDVIHNLVIQ